MREKCLARLVNPPFGLHDEPLNVSGVFFALRDQPGLLFDQANVIGDPFQVEVRQPMALVAMAS